MRKQPLRRLCGALFSLVYFFVNSVLASAPDGAFWAQRRRAVKERGSSPEGLLASLPLTLGAKVTSKFVNKEDSQSLSARIPQEIAKTLPASFFKDNTKILSAISASQGTIRRIKMPRGAAPKKIILHVQDVHLNANAQSRISALMSSVAENRAVDLVGLEGAFGRLDFSRYRAYPRRKIIQEVARALLQKGDISGPIHAALSENSEPPDYIGIDDPVHYRANVAAYRAAAPLQSSTIRRVEEDQRVVALAKARTFSNDLREFDERVTAYQEGRLSLGEHLKNLVKILPHTSPAITNFLETWILEQNLDFNQAEEERRGLVDKLVHSLDKKSLDSLSAMALACRAGSLTNAELYQQLTVASQKAGVSLDRFPTLAVYFRYVFEADRIHPEALFRDMRLAEDAAYARLVRTPEEKELVAEARRLYLTKKLAEFSLTPEEWAELKGKKVDEMAPFEEFYQEAQIRDDSMTQNFLNAMEKNHAKTALLVTGGFHSPGMEERFLKAGAAVISFTPRIDKIETAQGSAYLNVFTREKTPLDKMFQGRALFLTPLVFSPSVVNGTTPLLAAALESGQAVRGAEENTVTTTFKTLSTVSGAANAKITTVRLPGNQVGVTVKMDGATTTLWVKLSPGNDRILAYDTVRPGDQRTLEQIEGLFRKWFKRGAPARWIHVLAGLREWNFLSPRFVVQHSPTTPAEWVQQIQNRRWLIFGSSLILASSILFATTLSFWALPGPSLERAFYSFGATVPLSFLAKVIWHYLIDEFRRERGQAPATRRARPPPIENTLVAVVNALAARGLHPSVNECALSTLVENPKELLHHLHHYCVIRSPVVICKILQDRLSLPKGTQTMTAEQTKILDLYEGVFDQEAYLDRKFSKDHPLRIVIFRGGRGAASLTQLLARDPRIRVNAIVAGTDAGRGHRVPAHDFDTPGVPDMGKALLDLAQYELMKDFLGSRFQSSNGDYNDLSEEEYMKDFEGLTEFMITHTTSRTSPNLEKWKKKVDTFSEEERKMLGLFFASFLRVLKTTHSNQVIGDPRRDPNLTPFRFNNYPLRSIALQGAVWANLGEGWPDPWQRSVIALAKLLKVRKGDGVRIATANPQNLMAMATDGTVYFGETGLNEYPGDAEVVTLWMVDRFPLLRELVDVFKQKTGLSLESPTMEELVQKNVNPVVYEEIIATVRRLLPGQATEENIKKMERYFLYLSRSVRGAKNPVVVHHRTAEKIAEAHLILYGPGSQESNVISSMLASQVRQAIAENSNAAKIYFVNPTKENRRRTSTSATLLRSFYRPLSRPRVMFSRVRWTQVADFVDYAVGHSVEFPGQDEQKEYIPHSPAMIRQETSDRVVGVAIDLESKIPRQREGVDYQQSSPEFGFFHDPLTKEAAIALYAIKDAEKQLTYKGEIVDREKKVRGFRATSYHVRHMGMIRRRMTEMGISGEQQDALLAEMNDFTIKSQQWYYARLMRLLDFPVQLWLPECQNAEWTEMTSRMVELLNSITEVISLDFDDTLEKRNTDLSRVNALRLARRIATGQKIAFNTAKTPEEITSVINANTNTPGVELYGPLREALVDVLRRERADLPEEAAQNAADDLLHDLFFLYMNSGAALARPTVRGIVQAVDLPLDPYFTVVYPPELEEKITQVLRNAFGDTSQGNSLKDMVLKYFYGPALAVMKMIFQPFGPSETEKSVRERIADQINALFGQYNIPAHVNPAGKTSIDVNPYLPGGEVLEKKRAIQHLFNQGHRVVTFIDNEIFKGNAISVREMAVEMATHPEKRPDKMLRVIAVDAALSEEILKPSLGAAETLVRRLPDYALGHPEFYRSGNHSEILLMNGLAETEATAAFLRWAPYGIREARVNRPQGKQSYEAVLVLKERRLTSKLFWYGPQGRRKSVRINAPWNAQSSLLNSVTQAFQKVRQDVAALQGDINTYKVEVSAGYTLPDAAEFAAKLQVNLDHRVEFVFHQNKSESGVIPPVSGRPYSVGEQKWKAGVHGIFALTGVVLAFGHLVMGIGTAWALPVALLTASVFFRYAWRATLARNEHARLLAKASRWDPNRNQNESAQTLAAIQTQFQRFGFAPNRTELSSFTVTIKGNGVTVRLPKNSAELSDLLSRDRLAETRSKGGAHEIVIASHIDPALLPAVVLTEIHRVSPSGAVAAYFRGMKWFPFPKVLAPLMGGVFSLFAIAPSLPADIPVQPTINGQEEKQLPPKPEYVSAMDEIALTRIMIVLKMHEMGTIPLDQFLAELKKFAEDERTLFLHTKTREDAEESLRHLLKQVASRFTGSVAKSIPEGHPFYLEAQLQLEGLDLGETLETSLEPENPILSRLSAFLQAAQFQKDLGTGSESKSRSYALVKQMLQESVDEFMVVLRQNGTVGDMDPRVAYAVLSLGGKSLDSGLRKSLMSVIVTGLRSVDSQNQQDSIPLPLLHRLVQSEALFTPFMGWILKENRLGDLVEALPAEERVSLVFLARTNFPSELDRPGTDPRVREILTLMGKSHRGVSQEKKPSNKGSETPAPFTNSPIYLLTRDVRMALAGVLLLEMPLLVFLGPVSPAVVISIYSSIHVLIEAWQNPGRSWWKHGLSFFIHSLFFSPYALIGIPGDAMTMVAGGVHLVYDGVLMRLDQARLARQDMRAFGVPVPAEPRRPVLNLFFPPLESLEIDGLDGQSVRMARVSRRIKAGGPYAREWGGKVDTLVSFHQILLDDLPALRDFIENGTDKENGHFQILLVPGVNDPSLERALQDLSRKNVTVLQHSFEPSGEVKIDPAHFHAWSQGKGVIAWLTTKNPLASPILPDPQNPLLSQLLFLLGSAPPLTPANLGRIAAFARALLTAS